MSNLKPLIDILGHDDETQELYTSDQKKRYFRSQKGPYSRQKGLFNFLQLIKEWEVIVGKLMAQNHGGTGLSCSADIVITTPGRLVDHLDGTKGFSAEHLRFLVIDEADDFVPRFG